MTGYVVTLFKDGKFWKQQTMHLRPEEKEYWVRRYRELSVEALWKTN